MRALSGNFCARAGRLTGVRAGDRRVLRRPLVRGEEVQLVLDDRSAEREAGLRAVERLPAHGCGVGAVRLVAEGVEGGAVSSFVPLFVMALSSKPPKLPWRTSNGARRTWSSLTASIESGFALTSAPGVPVEPRPKTSRSVAPSIWTLFMRLDMPPAEAPGPVVETCGAIFTKSVRLRDVVGTRSRTESEMASACRCASG